MIEIILHLFHMGKDALFTLVGFEGEERSEDGVGCEHLYSAAFEQG